MTTNPNLPLAVSTESLVTILEDMLAHIREHDSFGGFLEYDAMSGPPCPEHEATPESADSCSVCLGTGVGPMPKGTEFMVRAGYRIGNSEGQGGMRFVCATE